eukprot:COSAG06_NODE_2886_length_6133_cov_5.617667_5_plen_170_part_00
MNRFAHTVVASSSPTVLLVVSKRNFDKRIRPNMPRFQRKVAKHMAGGGGGSGRAGEEEEEEEEEELGDVLASLLLRQKKRWTTALDHGDGVGAKFTSEGAKHTRGGKQHTFTTYPGCPLAFCVCVCVCLSCSRSVGWSVCLGYCPPQARAQRRYHLSSRFPSCYGACLR